MAMSERKKEILRAVQANGEKLERGTQEGDDQEDDEDG